MLLASLMEAFGRAYGLPYKMAAFIAKQGLFNMFYCFPIVSLCDPSVTISVVSGYVDSRDQAQEAMLTHQWVRMAPRRARRPPHSKEKEKIRKE